MFEGHEDIVAQLLAVLGVDVNKPDNDGQTPLWWAAHKGQEDIIHKLPAVQGVDVNKFDKCEKTPLWD